MNAKIVEQLRYCISQEGIAGFSKGAIVTYQQLKVGIESNAASIIPSLLDDDFERIQIVIPDEVYDKRYDLTLKAKPLDGDVVFAKGTLYITLRDLLCNGELNSENVVLKYEEQQQKVPSAMPVGAYTPKKPIFFIDKETGDIGHFPINFRIEITNGDRFLVFENELERDVYFIEKFAFDDNLGAGEVVDLPLKTGDECNCISCRTNKMQIEEVDALLSTSHLRLRQAFEVAARMIHPDVSKAVEEVVFEHLNFAN